MIEKKLTIDDVSLEGKRVLTRLDLNVPLQNGEVTDNERIIRALPTVERIAEAGAVGILVSHLGRPKGERNPELSLEPVARRLEEILGQSVAFVPDCIGDKVSDAIASAAPGELLLLENLRFYPGETKNDPDFARVLAAPADIFVNDAFGTAHRAHASTVGVTEFLNPSVAGYLMMQELMTLEGVVKNPERPFVSIIGGAKISSKIGVIRNLMPKVDSILLGGGLIFTFFKALGVEVGRSLVENEQIKTATDLIRISEDMGGKLLLPIDVVIADDIDAPAIVETVSYDDIPSDMIGLDIGDRTTDMFVGSILNSHTVVLTGPMGVFEQSRFVAGTQAVVDAMMELHDAGGTTVVGGGDSVAAAKRLGNPERFSHISTGGGASLKVMEGKELPAVTALTDR